MNEQEFLNELRSDVSIPGNVQRKADEAFAQIRAFAKETGKKGAEEEKSGKAAGPQIVTVSGDDPARREDARRRGKSGRKKPGGKKRLVLVAALAASLTAGTVAAAGTLIKWSHSTEKSMHVTESLKEQAESEGLIDSPDQKTETASATNDGVTVKAVETLADSYFARFTFNITGLEFGEDEEPGIDGINIYVDGTEVSYLDYSWSGAFYDGWVSNDTGTKAVHEDGSPIGEDEKENFHLPDGSCEFTLDLYNQDSSKPGELLGKPIEVVFTDMGIMDKTVVNVTKKGTWKLKWTMSGTGSQKEVTLDEKLGDTGATVTKAAISPLSILVWLEWPYQATTESAETESGEVITWDTYKMPPSITGVRLKNGKLLTGLLNGGSEGYEEPETTSGADSLVESPEAFSDPSSLQTFTYRFATSRLIDPDEVDALLFIKNESVPRDSLTEDDLYIVPVNSAKK